MSDLNLSTIADASEAGTRFEEPERLVALLEDTQQQGMAEYILQTDAEKHPQTREVLRAAIANPSAPIRRSAAKLLAGTLARQEDGAGVAALLAHANPSVRFGTLNALGNGALPRAQTDAVVAALVPLLADEDLNIRKEAIWATYLVGSEGASIETAAPALEKLIEDPATQGNAAIALSLALHAANDAARAVPLFTHASGAVQSGAAWGAADVHLRREDLAAMKAMFRDENDNLRRGLGAFLHHAKKANRSLALAGQAFSELESAHPDDALLHARLYAVRDLVERGPGG